MSFLLLFTGLSVAQNWSGILAPSRAIDWSQAGVVGGIPSASWTQCGSTIAPYAGSAAAINNAIAACGANQYVQLAAGSFSISTAINFGHQSNVVLRGMGPDQTSLVFASGANDSCGGSDQSVICIRGSDGKYPNGTGTTYQWTGGYTQGSTQITLNGTSGISTGTILVMDQCDDGYSGEPCSGRAIDNGGYFNCGDGYATSPSVSGCSFNGPDGGTGRAHRFQSELSPVVAVNAGNNVVTIASPLKHPQWRSGQTPEVWFYWPVSYAGVENLSIDSTADGANSYAIAFYNAANVWVKGVRVIKAPVSPIGTLDVSHFQFEQNYFYQAQSSDPYGFRITESCDGLIQNNIVQQIRVPFLDEGPDCGTVIAYNYFIQDYFNSDAMFAASRPHSNGDDYELFEGNIAANYYGEDYHGSHLMQTNFRNFYAGWELYSPAKDYQTNAFLLDSYNRYNNVIGNVLGTPGFHTAYQTTCTGCNNHAVYALGAGNGAVTPQVPGDPIVLSTLLRWGNYDVVNASNQFNPAEVPSSLPLYSNPVPSSQTLPASFYLSSKPSWWGSMPFPPIGPDVTGGSLGQCAGGTYGMNAALSTPICSGGSIGSGWGGHVNPNPAMACALNTMGMPPDGSGSVRSFNPSICYGSSSGNNSGTPPAAPTNLNGVVQ